MSQVVSSFQVFWLKLLLPFSSCLCILHAPPFISFLIWSLKKIKWHQICPYVSVCSGMMWSFDQSLWENFLPNIHTFCFAFSQVDNSCQWQLVLYIGWVNALTLRVLMSYIYRVHILDVSRSHTTTHHSR
jgi:hypothetical protein